MSHQAELPQSDYAFMYHIAMHFCKITLFVKKANPHPWLTHAHTEKLCSVEIPGLRISMTDCDKKCHREQ